MLLLPRTIEEDWGSYRASLRPRVSRLTLKLRFLLCRMGIIRTPTSERVIIRIRRENICQNMI